MAISLLNIIGFVFVTSFAGFNIIIAYDRKASLGGLELAGLSYLFGIGAISVEMFLLGLFGAKFSMPIIIIPWGLLSIINIPCFISRFSKYSLRTAKFQKLNLSETIVAALLIFVISYAFFMALVRPVESYDAVAIWSLKAKILYLARTMPHNFFTMVGARFDGAHPDYPLLLPLSEVWFYTFINNFNDLLVKALFPLNFLAFMAVFYIFLKKTIANRLFALIFTFILASVRQFSNYATNGYADMQMAIYASLTFLALYLWAREDSPAYFWTAFFSCIFAMWTKNEGAIVMIGFIAILFVRIFTQIKKMRTAVLSNYKGAIFPAVILGGLFILWSLFKSSMNIQNDVVNTGTFTAYQLSGVFKRSFAILYEYQRQIFGVKYWNLSWVAFILLAALGYKKLFSEANRYITIPTFLILLCYTTIYIITPQDIRWHLRTSASRLLIHILPLVIFYIGMRVTEIYLNE